jgi:hypothetical protein
VRYLKLMGLAALMAAALTAFLGASSASAVTLCKANENPCSNDYAAGTTISGSLVANTKAVLLSGIGNVECEESTVSGKTSELSGSPLMGLIESLTFAKCLLGSTSCTVTVENLPYLVSITASGSGNGTMTVEHDGTGGMPQAHVNCGSAFNCIVGNDPVTLPVAGGAPAIITAAQTMKLIENKGFICPSSATWDAKYAVSPSPMFVE